MNILLLLVLLPLPLLDQGEHGADSRGHQDQKSSDENRTPQAGMTTQEFLRELQARSRDAKAPARIQNFKIEANFGSQAKGKVEVGAEILFREPNYLRTTIREGNKTIVRGQEKYTKWMSQNDQAYKLQGRQYAEDRQAVMRDAALARLTLRFLYPERVLEGLVDLKGPFKAAYKVRRNRKAVQVPVWEMQGKAENPKNYPLVLNPDHEGDIQITAYFDCETLEPTRVYLRPLDKVGKPIPRQTEAIFFSDFKARFGLRIPYRLAFFQPDPKLKFESLKKVSTIRIKTFEVPEKPWNPSLFRMPTK